MKRTFRPVHGVLAIAILLASYLLIDHFFGRSGARFQRVSPDPQGQVTLDVSGLQPLEVRFYRFLNRGNQEVLFFVGRDETGAVQVAFDLARDHLRLAVIVGGIFDEAADQQRHVHHQSLHVSLPFGPSDNLARSDC